MANAFRVRPPQKYCDAGEAAGFRPPTNEWLEGTWYVTHTSLPLWENKRNVNITYTRLPPQQDHGVERIDDLVQYQALHSDKIKTVHGVDTPEADRDCAWQWRGKGFLLPVSSSWEVLGYGDLPDGQQWAVTFFAKTVFTPEGIDIYSRRKEGLPPDVMERIKMSLHATNTKEVEELVDRLYQVTMN